MILKSQSHFFYDGWPGEVLELLDLCRSIVEQDEAELNAAGEVS